MILKHNVHDKCVKVQEEEHGIDFFFKNRQHAQGLVEFLESMICVQLKQSKQLLSTDEQNGTQSYKFSYSVNVPKICKDDLIIVNEKLRKQLGAGSNILIVQKIAQMVKFLDPNTLNLHEVTGKKYFELEGQI